MFYFDNISYFDDSDRANVKLFLYFNRHLSTRSFLRVCQPMPTVVRSTQSWRKRNPTSPTTTTKCPCVTTGCLMASVTSMKTVILLMGRKKLMTGTIFVHLHRAKFSVKKTFPPTLSHQFSGQRCTQWCGCPWPHTKPYGCSSKSTVPFGLYTPCLFCISVPRS